MLFLASAFSVQEIFSDPKAADILEPPVSGILSCLLSFKITWLAAANQEGARAINRRALRWFPGVADGDQQRRHHLPNAGGLEECGPEQHHQADTLHHGGLAGGAQAADCPP